jgi:hypothetical protein
LHAWAGGHWTLTGTVVNGQHQPVPRAVVSLENTLTRKKRTAHTGRRGYFRLDGLKEHIEYEVTARLGEAASRPIKVSPLANELVVMVELELREP